MNEQMSDERPWGKWEILALGTDYKVKRITVKSRQRLSLQLHERREENWVVATGRGVVTVGDNKIDVKESTYVFIPKKTAHRIENNGKEDLVFIEVQKGDYLGEDDIKRIEDDYNRT